MGSNSRVKKTRLNRHNLNLKKMAAHQKATASPLDSNAVYNATIKKKGPRLKTKVDKSVHQRRINDLCVKKERDTSLLIFILIWQEVLGNERWV